MYEVLYLLAFSMCLANCEYIRNITMNIQVKKMENESRIVECQSRPNVVKLIHGELIQLIANVPYVVDNMWCETAVNNLNTTEGSGQQVDSQFTKFTRFNASQQGKWNCIYMLNTNETVQPIISYNKRNFTKATCNLTFEVPKSGRNISIEILKELDSESRAVCPDVNTKLFDGEPIQLITKSPYYIFGMECKNHKDEPVSTSFFNEYLINGECTTTTSVTRFLASQQGTWECKYEILDNLNVKDTAVCKVIFEVKDPLMLKGLQPNRTTQNNDVSRTNYNYKYKRGEKISINCEAQSEFEIMEFKLYDVFLKNFTNYTGKQFEVLAADLNLNASCLVCIAESPIYGTKHEILLDLEMIPPGYLWFSGLDITRTTIAPADDGSGVIYNYKYNKGEFLNISCERNPDVEMYNLIFSDRRKWTKNLTGNRLENTAESCFVDAKLICKLETLNFTIQINFNKIYNDPSPVQRTTTPSNSVITTSVAPVSTTHRLLFCDTMNTPIKAATITALTTTALSGSTGGALSQNANLNMTVDGVREITKNDTIIKHKTKTYLHEFSKPGIKNISCQFNTKNYRVEIYDRDNTTFRQGNKQFDGDKITVSLNFTLEKRDKTVICKAIDNNEHNNRTYISTLNMIYKKNTNEISELEKTTTTTTTESATTTLSQSPLTDASSFLKENGLLIGVVCAIVITLCVVACCLKIMCSKTKPQPPEDHVNLTSDRGNDYNTTTAAPIRTMPKIESNYCNPKDSQGRKNNADPNYSEPKEPQGMGEGLYAELNRPEDTYAEPYIDKTELMYARPIPKAQRKKKEDPNYGNVFGLYANSKK